MRRDRVLLTAAIALLALVSPAAAAQKFSILATRPGEQPFVGAIHAGVIYGTEAFGGASGAGAVFSLKKGQFSVLYSFSGGTDGKDANRGLDLDTSGNLFGTTFNGGSTNHGTLFELSTSGVLTVLHNFGLGNDGYYPMQGLVRTGQGVFFGATQQGTPNNDGNIFELAANGTYTVLHSFLSGADGHCPFSGVTRDQHGNIYGTTWGGGVGGDPTGSVWKINSKGVFSTLYVFQNATDGEWPTEAPVIDKTGNIYGTTHTQNGKGFAGAVWKIDAKGNFSVLHALNGASDGSMPNAPLVIGSDGNLYGTASQGALGFGTLFQVTPAGAFTVEHSFSGGADGGAPTGSLVTFGSQVYGGAGGVIFDFLF